MCRACGRLWSSTDLQLQPEDRPARIICIDETCGGVCDCLGTLNVPAVEEDKVTVRPWVEVNRKGKTRDVLLGVKLRIPWDTAVAWLRRVTGREK